MSFAHWDELLVICMELAENDNEKVAIKEIRVIREPTPTETDPKDFALTIPVPAIRSVKLGKVVGFH